MNYIANYDGCVDYYLLNVLDIDIHLDCVNMNERSKYLTLPQGRFNNFTHSEYSLKYRFKFKFEGYVEATKEILNLNGINYYDLYCQL